MAKVSHHDADSYEESVLATLVASPDLLPGAEVVGGITLSDLY